MTKSTGVGRGPKKAPWAKDPDRFRLAYLWVMSVGARTGRSPRLSERAAANNMAVLAATNLSTLQVKALRKTGSLDFLMMQPIPRLSDDERKRLCRTGNVELYRGFDNSEMITAADTIRKKFNRLKKHLADLGNQADRDYFGALEIALIATLSAPDYERAFDIACLYTDLVCERSWFLEGLAPHIKARFGRT